jgi:hypothetical protein
VNVLRDNISTVQQASGHVLSIARIALYHLVVWLEAGHGDLLDGVGLVGRLGSRDNRRISYEREMNTRVWHKVGLELIQINVKRAIEAKGGSDRRHNYQYAISRAVLSALI